VPFLQALGLPVHDCPATHATHAPAPSQTLPTPQLTPPARLAPSLQLVAPAEHAVVPCLHAVGLPVQVCPATQAPQKPLPSHICPPVHSAVAAFGMPSAQVDAPVTQEVTPSRQIDGLVLQACPAVHDTQVPLPLQT
jgi:hypothetical protein